MVLVVAQVLQWSDVGPQAQPASGLVLPLGHTTPATLGYLQAMGRPPSCGLSDSSGAPEKTGTCSPVLVSMRSRGQPSVSRCQR